MILRRGFGLVLVLAMALISSALTTGRSAAAGEVLASDGFSRVLSSGWGAADSGGSWSACGGSCGSLFSVSGGAGRVSVGAGKGPEAYLSGVSSSDADASVTVSVDRAATGGGTYAALVVRGGYREGYRGKVSISSSGAVTLGVVRAAASVETLLKSAPAGFSFAAGDRLRLRMQAVGVSPTVLAFKAWREGSAEPAGWQVSVSDAAGSWQKPGAVGVWGYVSSSATNGPAVVSFDDLAVSSMSGPVTNAPPVAVASASVSGLSVSVDGSGSSDPDGSVVAWAWEFGDGSTASGAKPAAHAYAVAGDYQVKLTVTDDRGATATTTRSVPVAPAGANPVTINVVTDLGYCGPGGKPNEVSALLKTLPGSLVAPGDMAYPNGSAADFANCYDPIFGWAKPFTYPVPGNHEYNTAQAVPYFDYFGSRVGTVGTPWYSMDIGRWHFVMLNSNCTEVGGCDAASAQYRWLESDLSAQSGKCLAAVWHHPRYTSSDKGPATSVEAMWSLLQAKGADVVFNGHAHHYERFARMNSTGSLDAAGIREFVVGTGGAALYPFVTTVPGSQVQGSSFGVLRVTLTDDSFQWNFVPISGSTFTDSGAQAC